MKGRPILISVLALGLMLALAAGLSLAQGPGPQGDGGIQAAPVGTSFTYQGRLNDGGNPANGAYDLQFKLYNAASGGSQVGSTVTKGDVVVTDGLFTVELDFGSGVFTGDASWLEIGVRQGASTGAYTTLTPRQALTATPYALYALSADTTYLQRRVSASCTSGNAIRVVNEDGTVTCEPVVGGGAHDHLGETWTGNTPLTISGDFTDAPLVLNNGGGGEAASGLTLNPGDGLRIQSASDDGVQIDSAGGDGVYVKAAGDDGVTVDSASDEGVFVKAAGEDGVLVEVAGRDAFSAGNAGGDGLYVVQAGDDGVDVRTAADNGVYVGSAGNNGMQIGSAGHDGVSVTSPGRDGLYVDSPGYHGVYVTSAGLDGVQINQPGDDGVHIHHPGDEGVYVAEGTTGFHVESPSVDGFRVNSAARYGLFVGSPGWSGVRVDSPGQSGVWVDSPSWQGVYVNSPGQNGFWVDSPGWDGVYVTSPGGHGVRVDSADKNGVYVNGAGDDGVRVWSTGRYGVYADTNATYGFFTPDKIYAGNGYVDIAEHIDAASDVEPGDVVVIDPDHDERVVKSTRPYDTLVAGIISTDPALLIGKSDTETPLALAGRAPCKVSAENGAIHRGDLLTTSSTPGHAMKATNPQLGTILGKALGELESGTGVIPVLVTLQ